VDHAPAASRLRVVRHSARVGLRERVSA
jgi:hypothetical protein